MTSPKTRKTIWSDLLNASWLPIIGLTNAALLYFLFHFFSRDQFFFIPEGLKFRIMGVLYLSSYFLILVLGISVVGNLFYKQWKKSLVRLAAGSILFLFSSAVFMGQTSGARLKVDAVTWNKQDMAVTTRVLKKYYKVNSHYPTSLKEVDYFQYRLYPGEGIKTFDSYGSLFDYRPTSDRQAYQLRSLGPDKVYDTTDDIVAK